MGIQLLKYRNKSSWDACTYDQVSRLIQYRWGQQVIKWRQWRGNEIVMDAGCGTGLLTKQLTKQVPRGKVYAVDIDTNMIKQAKNNLKSFGNVKIIQSNFTDVMLTKKMDVVFSNSALHWVQDHRKAFQKFWEMLKPMNSNDIKDISVSSNSNDNTGNSGQILIQCGGYGNLEKTRRILDKIKDSEKFKDYFKDWKSPWYFASPYDTETILRKVGFRNIHTYIPFR